MTALATILADLESKCRAATPGLAKSGRSEMILAWPDYIERSAASVAKWLPTDVGLPAVPVKLLRHAPGGRAIQTKPESTGESGGLGVSHETLDTKRAGSASSAAAIPSSVAGSGGSESCGCEAAASPKSSLRPSITDPEGVVSGAGLESMEFDSLLPIHEDSITSFLARREASTGSRTWLCLAAPATALVPLANHIAAWSPDRALRFVQLARAAAQALDNCNVNHEYQVDGRVTWDGKSWVIDEKFVDALRAALAAIGEGEL